MLKTVHLVVLFKLKVVKSGGGVNAVELST